MADALGGILETVGRMGRGALMATHPGYRAGQQAEADIGYRKSSGDYYKSLGESREQERQRTKQSEQLNMYLKIIGDRTGAYSEEAKKAAGDSALRLPVLRELQQRLGGGQLRGEQRDWWSGLVSPQQAGGVRGIGQTGAGEAPPVSPFRVESIAGKPGETQPTITFKPTAASPMEKRAYGTKLRTEFNALSKDFRAVRDSYSRVLASTVNPSAAGDLALIFNYMKMLDPGSVVRESEFANAAASGSLGERWIAAGKKLLTGERLSDKMRADFLDRSHKLYKSQKGIQEKHIKRYSGLAQRAGIKSEDVVAEIEMKVEDGLTPEQSRRRNELRRKAGL